MRHERKFIFLYFQLDTLFFPSTYNICYPLSSTCFRPHRPIIRRSKLYMQPVVQFRPPDDGPLRPETCRGKRIADIARRRKTVYQVGNKEKLY